MPRLGWDMKVGSVAEWLKRDGDRVEIGEPICMIAGDKATTELEALDTGILRIPPRSPEVGEEVPVGTLLAYLVAPDEDLRAEPASAAGSAGGAEPTGVAGNPGAMAAASAGGAATAGGAAGADQAHREPLRPSPGPDAGGAQQNGSRRIVASPRARRAAAALGVDWRAVAGSGRGGRVLERDVQHASSQATPAPHTQAEPALPLQGVRRLTAERMSLSARTVAPVTLTTEADATTLVRLREQALAEQAAAREDVPGYTDLIVKLAALALVEHPALNAELTEAGIVQHPRVNVGIAVDTPRGLFVPVVRDAATTSLVAITSESRRLIGAAREGTSRPEDLAGATFTITNLGMFEIDAFTPIVNLPQCAVLGLGRIVPRPVVVDAATEHIGVRSMLSLSLTFDHRLVDGAPAARFLQRVKHFVERPTLWLFR